MNLDNVCHILGKPGAIWSIPSQFYPPQHADTPQRTIGGALFWLATDGMIMLGEGGADRVAF